MDGPDKEMEALLPCNPIHGTTPPMLSTLPIGITSFFFKLIFQLDVASNHINQFK